MELHLGIYLSTLIKEEKMGDTTKIWIQVPNLYGGKVNYLMVNQSLIVLLKSCLNLAIILGTILIDSNWLV